MRLGWLGLFISLNKTSNHSHNIHSVNCEFKTENVLITWRWDMFVQPVFQWKNQHSQRVFVELGMQHAKRTCHIVTVACSVLQYFSSLSHKRHDFRKTLLNIRSLFWCSLILPKIFLSLRTNERDMMKIVFWSSCKVTIIRVRSWWN